MEKKLEALENLMPGLQDYFENVLTKEKLTATAEERRLFLTTEIEKICEYRNPRRDSLPSLPPPAPPSCEPSQLEVSEQNNNSAGCVYDNTLSYDYAEEVETKTADKNGGQNDDNVYEEPVPIETNAGKRKNKTESNIAVNDENIYEDTDVKVQPSMGKSLKTEGRQNIMKKIIFRTRKLSAHNIPKLGNNKSGRPEINPDGTAHSPSLDENIYDETEVILPPSASIQLADHYQSLNLSLLSSSSSPSCPPYPGSCALNSTGYDSDASGSYEEFESEEGEENTSSGPSRHSSNKSTSSEAEPSYTKPEKKSKNYKKLFASQISDPAVTYYGLLHQKRLMGTQWSKRFCIVRDMRFIAYKYSKEEQKVVLDFPLIDFKVDYVKKEGKRSHVLKISYPGVEKYLFSVDKKKDALKWVQVLKDCAQVVESKNSPAHSPVLECKSSSPSSSSRQVLIIENEQKEKSELEKVELENTNLTETPTSPIKATDASFPKVDKHVSLAATASSLWPFKKGKKKSISSIPASDIPRITETSISISGYLNMCSSRLSDGKWHMCWCNVKDNYLKCYKVNSEECEIKLHLQGCEIRPVSDSKKKGLSYKFQLQQNNQSIVVAQANTLDDMARWVRVLITEIGITEEEEDFMEDYVSPNEIFESVVKRSDGEVVTQKDIVSKTMKLFEHQQFEDSENPYLELMMGGDSAKEEDADKDSISSTEMSNSVAKGETVRRIAEQLGKTVAPTESSTKNGGEFDEEGKMIEKEKEILNSTENAFLEKIRLQRRISMVNKIHTQRERLQTEKSYLNKMLSDLRAHRLELKDKKMLCREPAEKRKLDNNFREIDLEINQTEEELQVVNAQLEKLTLDLDDAREEMDISLETMSGDSEDYFDCQEEGSSQLSNKSSKHNNTESSSERRKPVLQHAKMFEAMARK